MVRTLDLVCAMRIRTKGWWFDPHWEGCEGMWCQNASMSLLISGSHTSQMKKFKAISRVIKGSTTHFQGYFWKTVVTLSYIIRFLATSPIYFKICFWSIDAAF